ncbi:hypothetical protein HDU93_010058, partial [Gonapodya sp. JEL0774]
MLSIGYPEEVAGAYALLKSSFTTDAMELDRKKSDWRPLIKNRWSTDTVPRNHYYHPGAKFVEPVNKTGNVGSKS